MTKKEFMLQVVEQLTENPRKVLAGHGIQATVLQTIVKRPDVMFRLASVLYSLKTAKKGASGLKKAKNFQIKGYKSFPEMNMKAREDIENFIAGLDEADQDAFNNSENVITILMLPDVTTKVQDEEGNLSESIVTGATVPLKFDNAVRKEYKIPGGMYIVVMIGNSAIRSSEEKIALRDKKAQVKEAKKTPAKVKAELRNRRKLRKQIAKKRAELAGVNAQIAGLQADRYNLQMQAKQRADLADILGDEDVMYGIGKRNMQVNNYQINKMGIIAGLNAEDKTTYNFAKKLYNSGKTKLAVNMLNAINPALVDVLTGTPPVTADAVIDARKAELRKKVRMITRRNEQLLLDLSLAPDDSKRRSIKSMISKNNSQIKALRARLGTYKNLSATGIANKAAMLQQVNADIEAKIAEGATISQALNASLAQLNAKPQQKQIIKQQVMQQVADGMPMQYAVQQAIQQTPVEQLVTDEDMADTTLTGNYGIEDLLAALS